MIKKDMVELPRRGRALIITDLHGNMDNFRKVMDLWGQCVSKRCHLIITGDFIHEIYIRLDDSLSIIDEIQHQFKNKNFHPLLGNHEWATITHTNIYKGGVNQNSQFYQLIEKNYGNKAEEKLEEYINFFKKLPIVVKTGNGVFISHAGPPNNLKSFKNLTNITENGYKDNRLLYQLLWNRYGDYDEKDVDKFLEKIGCQAMVVGHTPVDGIKLIGNQLVVSVSPTSGKRAYVDLNLEDNIKDASDLKKMVKYFNL
jgi:serine/threonine-protein phosphatase PP1 catalytic subunit